MDTNPLTPTTGSYLKSLKIIFGALLAGQVFFAVVAWFMIKSGTFPATFSFEKILLIAVILLAAAIIGAGIYIFNSRMTALSERRNFSEKLNDYRAALIVKYATTEGPSFFAIVAFMLTGNMIILGIGIAIIAYFATLWPSVEKLAGDMNLNPGEKMKLENPDTMI